MDIQVLELALDYKLRDWKLVLALQLFTAVSVPLPLHTTAFTSIKVISIIKVCSITKILSYELPMKNIIIALSIFPQGNHIII